MENDLEQHPYHEWGDDSFDWVGLDDAMSIIHNTCVRWGRLGVHYKEKYGTARISTFFFCGQLHELIYPGYVYNQFPKWFWSFDITYIMPAMRFLRIVYLIQWWQAKVYNFAYQQALKKYPHLREEILVDADQPHLIDGGTEVHNKYWKTVA